MNKPRNGTFSLAQSLILLLALALTLALALALSTMTQPPRRYITCTPTTSAPPQVLTDQNQSVVWKGIHPFGEVKKW